MWKSEGGCLFVAMTSICVVMMTDGCSTTSTPATSAPVSGAAPPVEAGPDACSSGPPYDSATFLEQRDADTPLPERQCVPRCADTSQAYWGAGGGPTPTVSALPTGACDAQEACSMQAVRVFCQGTSDQPTFSPDGALFEFECACNEHNWRCKGNYVSGGAGVYPPCPAPSDGGDVPVDGGR
jgi:hypothetical protein